MTCSLNSLINGRRGDEGAADVFGAESAAAEPAGDVTVLYAKIGDLTPANDFLVGALRMPVCCRAQGDDRRRSCAAADSLGAATRDKLRQQLLPAAAGAGQRSDDHASDRRTAFAPGSGTLEDALARYGKPAIFNSYQESQFKRTAFTAVLYREQMVISKDGKGCWRDDVFVERL